ncbi:hypothetical protein EYF80_055293 [Liparis tanakae]|uniref:Uncharacterized protein n=1 Tax=Liparis tanakae TaxID=230148 RepID=A0A4Z2F0Z5_9TELE|nr:hypothetical protein EYF80_055293 [Liparis tanakae]
MPSTPAMVTVPNLGRNSGGGSFSQPRLNDTRPLRNKPGLSGRRQRPVDVQLGEEAEAHDLSRRIGDDRTFSRVTSPSAVTSLTVYTRMEAMPITVGTATITT